MNPTSRSFLTGGFHVPAYFLSDVHLRHDFPDRGRRLASLVDRLGPDDPLTIAGDLCDYWAASRQQKLDPLACPGLRSIADYSDRGGRLTVLAGNHDVWLGPVYQERLGAEWVTDSTLTTAHGLRLHVVHGHRLGAQSPLKRAMESRLFLNMYAGLPHRVALMLEARLEQSKQAHRRRDDVRHLATFRTYADRFAGSADLVVIGHVHVVFDDAPAAPRLIVLGNWHERGSFLRVDDEGAKLLYVKEDVVV